MLKISRQLWPYIILRPFAVSGAQKKKVRLKKILSLWQPTETLTEKAARVGEKALGSVDPLKIWNNLREERNW